jgi:hypothetical protein
MRIEDLPLGTIIGTVLAGDEKHIVDLLRLAPHPPSFPITHAGMFLKNPLRLFLSHPYSNAIELYPPIATKEAFAHELTRLDKSKIRRERRRSADEYSAQAWEISTANTGNDGIGIIVLPIWI